MELQLIKYVRRALAFCIVKQIKKKLKLLKLVEAKEKLKQEDLKLDYVGSYGNEEHKAIDSELPVFDFGMIATSVNNFSDHNKLGQGGFGPVYKGNLPGGQEIAVKRLSKMSGQGITEFMNEVALVSKLQHRNLVQLLGCCIDGEEKLLLYEFMPNKSLDCFLFDSIKKRLLDWPRRYSIIEGIARGLLYLHRDSRLRIIHRDMKASNILLDELFNAKISDFGLARMFKGDQILATTKRVVGTIGYMSPEYAMEGRFSEKSDVFSFGVLILEILSGKRNNSFADEEQYVTLIGYTWALWSSNKALELIDQSIGETFSKPEVLKCIQVGLLCVQEYPSDRPTMSAVVSMLSTDTCLPSPKQAAFFGRTSPWDLFPCFEEKETCSTNDLTITEVGCR